MGSGVFVVSTGRCGSTLLSEMLRLNPEILSLSEFFIHLVPDPFPRGDLDAAAYWNLLSMPNPFITLLYRLNLPVEECLYRPDANSRFNAATGIPPILVTPLPHLSDDPEALYDEVAAFVRSLSPARVVTQHRHLFSWLCARAGARIWIERSGGSLVYLSRMIDLFPGARFIHLYRDGRECAYSMSRSAGFRLGALSMVLQSRLGRNPYLSDCDVKEPVPADLRPFMPDTFDHEAFERFTPSLTNFGRWWSGIILASLDLLETLPEGRVFQVSYENLITEPRRILTTVARFAGLTAVDAGWLDQAARLVRPRLPRWPTLPADQLKGLSVACQPAMERLYGRMC